MRKIYIIIILILLFPLSNNLFSKKNIFVGKIESLRKKNRIVILIETPVINKKYYILNSGNYIGTITFLSKLLSNNSNKIRIIGEYKIFNPKNIRFVSAGSDIIIKDFGKKILEKKENFFIERMVYLKKIISVKDKREMILIPKGDFFMGKNGNEADEYPIHKLFSDNFYIDKYEVSNSDYKKYMEESEISAPLSWKNNIIIDSLPVLITYDEALKYAKWAGKRLPSEIEWEKAATGNIPNIKGKYNYPWGKKLNKNIVNFKGFWGKKIKKSGINKFIVKRYLIILSGTNVKAKSDKIINFCKKALDYKKKIFINKKYSDFNCHYINIFLSFSNYKKLKSELKTDSEIVILNNSPLPVYFFNKTNISKYGVVNMSGNVMEWTSSWYKPYEGNSTTNKKFGNKFKVVRGGCWFSDENELKIHTRNTSGYPSLKRDNISGFRCVKEVNDLDRI